MPIITVQQLSGRTPAQKKALAEGITRAVREIYGATAQPVQVLIQEVPTNAWFSEGAPVESLPRNYGGSSATEQG